MSETKDFSKCKFCGADTVGFLSTTYCDRYIVRCENCGIEIEYASKAEAERNK